MFFSREIDWVRSFIVPEKEGHSTKNLYFQGNKSQIHVTKNQAHYGLAFDQDIFLDFLRLHPHQVTLSFMMLLRSLVIWGEAESEG